MDLQDFASQKKEIKKVGCNRNFLFIQRLFKIFEKNNKILSLGWQYKNFLSETS